MHNTRMFADQNNCRAVPAGEPARHFEPPPDSVAGHPGVRRHYPDSNSVTLESCRFTMVDGRFVPQRENSQIKIFEDRDIRAVRVTQDQAKEFPGMNGQSIYAAKTTGGLTVLQQISEIACGPTCIEMLRHDLTQRPLNRMPLISGSGTFPPEMVHSVQLLTGKEAKLFSVGVRPVRWRDDDESTVLEAGDLAKFLRPAAISAHNHKTPLVAEGVTTENGGHWILIDGYDRNQRAYEIRDPYHGWAIAVWEDAMLRFLRTGAAIILTKPQPR